LFALSFDQNLSANSQDPPKVPAVISQTEFDYQGAHFVVQLVPSSDATTRKVDANGGQFSEGDFALRSGAASIVLSSESKVLSEITALQDAEFVLDIPDFSWKANGESPIFLLTRKDKLPLIVVPQYANSGGSYYWIYLIQQSADKFELKAIKFSDPIYLGALFGDSIQMFYDEIKKEDFLRIHGYDNSIGAPFTKYYIADYEERSWKLTAPAENSEE
jgi:hypothetical protein